MNLFQQWVEFIDELRTFCKYHSNEIVINETFLKLKLINGFLMLSFNAKTLFKQKNCKSFVDQRNSNEFHSIKSITERYSISDQKFFYHKAFT